jgi:vacuolar-type H+-ATPase subunit E/Vma4
MPSDEKRDDSLQAELDALGENLQRVIRKVWESEERRQLQADVEQGLEGTLQHLRQELKDFQESETAERLKADLGSVERELRSGETAGRVRQEILDVLRRLNAELGRATRPASEADEPPGKSGG